VEGPARILVVYDPEREPLQKKLLEMLSKRAPGTPITALPTVASERLHPRDGEFAVVLPEPRPSAVALRVLNDNPTRAVAVTPPEPLLNVAPVRASQFLAIREAPTDTELDAVARKILQLARAVGARDEADAPPPAELTASFRRTRDRFAAVHVSAYELVLDLLERHPDVRHVGAYDDLVRDAPTDDARMPGPAWVEWLHEFVEPTSGQIHARLAIVGLALADAVLGRWMAARGLLESIEAEIEEPIRTQLTPAGLVRRNALMRQPLPGYVPDSTAGSDLLGIERDVAAFAAILAARDTTPPVSVGLFGRWGTGKSFFMERLRERIASLGSENPEIYCSNVVQVRFNAWHYIDSNLWASLVAHIFETLANHGKSLEDDGTGQSGETENLLANLVTTGELVEAKRAEQEEAEERHAAIEKELGELNRLRRSEREELAALNAGTISAAVEGDDEVSQRLDAVRASLGIDAEATKGLLDLARWREGGGVAGRLALALRYLWAKPLALAGIVALALALVAVALVFGTGWLAAVAAVVVPAVGVMGAVLRVTGPVGELLDAADRARRARVEALRTELGELERRAEQARAERREAERREAEARRALERATSGSGLRRFIEERATSDQYTRKLGIIASVQRDFERLSELMAGRARGQPAMDEDGKPLPDIERIVLYVDDLDRCPPETVVAVLEAVHLLMAFPLFVVVVGVDPGWLERSLKATRLKSEHSISTPRDYLEKIFQIPFALRPMGGEGYARLVQALLPTTRADSAPPRVGRAVTSEGPPPGDPDADPAETGRAPAREEAPVAPVAIPVPSLTIERSEMEALTSVGPLIPTPRATKRLVNAYRFIRAGVGPTELDAFLGYGQPHAAYKAVVAMLTALIAFPDDAPAFFEPVRRAKYSTWEDVVAEAAGETGVDPVFSLANLMDIPADYPMSHFAAWLPRVERFSFGI
jgi:hypothetical protein